MAKGFGYKKTHHISLFSAHLRLIANGIGTDIYTVQHLLAHKNVSTTQIYVAHASPKTREAANKIKLKEEDTNENE